MLRLAVQFKEPNINTPYIPGQSRDPQHPPHIRLCSSSSAIPGTMFGPITLSALNPFRDSSTTNLTNSPTSRQGPDRWQLVSTENKNKNSNIDTGRKTTTIFEREEDEFVLIDKKRGGMFDYWVPYNDNGESLRLGQGTRRVKVSRRLQFTLVNGLYFGSWK